MIAPPAIIFVNNDLSDSATQHLQRQLMITQTMDGYSFDAAVAADEGFITTSKNNLQRILVIRTFLGREEVSTWTLPDVVIFVKMGLAAVLKNNFGPPGLTLPVLKLTWPGLGVYE